VIWTAVYVASVVLVNVVFGIVPWIGSFIVGGVFILRDRCHEEVGSWWVAAFALAAGVTYLMADPFVAAASVKAFIVAGLADGVTFALARRRWGRRRAMVASQLVGVPLDSWIFLSGLGALSAALFATQVASKCVALAVLAHPFRRPELSHD
jgi:uncharacterized PurR-regulated membrane protein YhhQ (DUF165 family)